MVAQAIAIIPARGGSKRIPKKNIIDFCGKPLIAWTIEAAIQSACFDRVLVSTDDVEIATVAKEFGASVPFLREENADDYAPVSEATLSALAKAESYWGEKYKTVTQLMPNCPIRMAQDIVNAMKKFSSGKAKFQISCFKFGWMNPWWAVKLDGNGVPERLFPEATLARSQDLEQLFCPTGAIWIADIKAFKENKTFYGVGHVFEPMDWMSAIDIDDVEDLEMAQAIYLLQNNINA